MSDKSEKLIPHPTLKEYYKHEGLRKEFVDKTFNETASKYDCINQFLSLGSGNWYRKQALLRAGLDSKMSALDVATGTGMVAKSEVSIVGPEGKVIGLDRSYKMLKKAEEKLNIPLILGDAGRLPFQNDTFNFLSMGYALRHVDDLKVTFREYFRVLKPGGILLILELMRPTHPLTYRMVRLYFKFMVALISIPGIGGKDGGQLIRYYWDTINEFVGSDGLKEALSESGFIQVDSYQLFNFFSEFTAVKP